MHIISVNMSALPHCQMGDKQTWSDNRDNMTFEFPTHVNIYVLMGELWWNVGRTQQVFLYSSVNDNIAHIAVQVLPNDRIYKLHIVVLII